MQYLFHFFRCIPPFAVHLLFSFPASTQVSRAFTGKRHFVRPRGKPRCHELHVEGASFSPSQSSSFFSHTLTPLNPRILMVGPNCGFDKPQY
uniref:Uncharacterized protein n=1 Tax=Physcomitrium patens TaxID=3218 RepID=A0A2K1J7L5_PHYPA|nr:hypothetical protein PHYPA_020625 [Physcomitrium patens]